MIPLVQTFDAPPPERTFLHGLRVRAGIGLGLLFLIGPAADLLRASFSPERTALIWAGFGAFVALYVLLLVPPRWSRRAGAEATVAALGAMLAIAIALLAGGAPDSFVGLFVYFAAAVGFVLHVRPALTLIGATAAGVGIASVATGHSDSSVGATVLTIVAIGAMTAAFARKIHANWELRRAREELANLAVAEERLRIARDVHDLLGHSLSVIALKSELAAKLLERDPERAAAELADVNAVSRSALAEVRETVQGYRRLALGEAIDGARSALAAAGIGCELHEPGVALPEEVEGVLAWAVREGATNVVRHSGARRCAIRIHADDTVAAVEVEDDGRAAGAAGEGSGLAGLAERAERVRGRLEAGAKPGGGFRLSLTVPLAS